MENWTELYTWMEQTTGSTDPEKFRSLVGANRTKQTNHMMVLVIMMNYIQI